jgi:hypothetical protein
VKTFLTKSGLEIKFLPFKLIMCHVLAKHSRDMKLKYKVNHTRVRYNNKTGMYETGSQTFARYEQAKENRWTCEKCFSRFATLKKLKQHKIDYHAY